MKIVAVDAMGGDHGPSVTVSGSLRALASDPNLKLILIGLEPELSAALSSLQKDFPEDVFARMSTHFVSEVVESDEPVANALRFKKNSSMRVAVDMIKEGKAHACVSAGNTGALMAISRFVLKMVEGIDRPAILARFPTQSGRVTHVIDVGANVDVPAVILCQFALMGSIISHALERVDRPLVGLLNIGEEVIKGNDTIKAAADYLNTADDIKYHGFIEANDLFKGDLDVIVCDGFVGNVALKTAEGLVKYLKIVLQNILGRGFWFKLMCLPFYYRIKKLKSMVDPRSYNGASLVGLNGVVIKSHGSSDELAFSNAVTLAAAEIDMDIPGLMSEQSKIFLNFLNSLNKDE